MFPFSELGGREPQPPQPKYPAFSPWCDNDDKPKYPAFSPWCDNDDKPIDAATYALHGLDVSEFMEEKPIDAKTYQDLVRSLRPTVEEFSGLVKAAKALSECFGALPELLEGALSIAAIEPTPHDLAVAALRAEVERDKLCRGDLEARQAKLERRGDELREMTQAWRLEVNALDEVIGDEDEDA